MSTVTTSKRDENKRREDEQAREEIRQLFARYRRLGRHGVRRQRDEQGPPQSARPSTAPKKA